jgi:hypothetical protein
MASVSSPPDHHHLIIIPSVADDHRAGRVHRALHHSLGRTPPRRTLTLYTPHTTPHHTTPHHTTPHHTTPMINTSSRKLACSAPLSRVRRCATRRVWWATRRSTARWRRRPSASSGTSSSRPRSTSRSVDRCATTVQLQPLVMFKNRCLENKMVHSEQKGRQVSAQNSRILLCGKTLPSTPFFVVFVCTYLSL